MLGRELHQVLRRPPSRGSIRERDPPAPVGRVADAFLRRQQPELGQPVGGGDEGAVADQLAREVAPPPWPEHGFLFAPGAQHAPDNGPDSPLQSDPISGAAFGPVCRLDQRHQVLDQRLRARLDRHRPEIEQDGAGELVGRPGVGRQGVELVHTSVPRYATGAPYTTGLWPSMGAVGCIYRGHYWLPYTLIHAREGDGDRAGGWS